MVHEPEEAREGPKRGTTQVVYVCVCVFAIPDVL